ncbi:unnamed protein product [Pylaiella littoralis]
MYTEGTETKGTEDNRKVGRQKTPRKRKHSNEMLPSSNEAKVRLRQNYCKR